MTLHDTQRLLVLTVTTLVLAGCGDDGQSATAGRGSGGTVPTSAAGGTGDTPAQGTGGAPAGGTGATSVEDTGGASAGGTGGIPANSGGTAAEVAAASNAEAANPPAPTTGGAPPSQETGGASGTADTAGQGGVLEPNEPPGDLWGFSVRQPQTRTIECSVTMTEDLPAQQVSDADQVCTFSYDGVTGYVYLEATVVDCEYYYALVGEFSARAWLSIDGQITELEDARYSVNGDHFTDVLTFDHAARSYQYWHSSFAQYYRSCQPMDCLRVYDAATGVHDATTLVADGCMTERTLPVVCVAVEPDGTVPPLEDDFAPCPGSEDWLPMSVGG